MVAELPLPPLQRAEARPVDGVAVRLPDSFDRAAHALLEPEADGGVALFPFNVEDEDPLIHVDGEPARSRIQLREGSLVTPPGAAGQEKLRFRERRAPRWAEAWAAVDASPRDHARWEVLADLLLTDGHPLAELIAHNRNPYTDGALGLFAHGFPTRLCLEPPAHRVLHPLLVHPWGRYLETLEIDFERWERNHRYFTIERLPHLDSLLLTRRPAGSLPPPRTDFSATLKLASVEGISAAAALGRFVEHPRKGHAVVRAHSEQPAGAIALGSAALFGLFATPPGQALEVLEFDPRSFTLAGVSHASGELGAWLRLIENALPPPELQLIRLGPFPAWPFRDGRPLKFANEVLDRIRLRCPKVQLELLADDLAWLEWQGEKRAIQELDRRRVLELEPGTQLSFDLDRWLLTGPASVNGQWPRGGERRCLRGGDVIQFQSGLSAVVRMNA